MRFPTTHILKSERCRLRYVSKDDIPHIFSAAQHTGFTDGMQWYPPKSVDELIAPYESNVKEWKEDRSYCFTIETIGVEEFIGRISIRKQQEENVWDLGFWTHPTKQGHGFMTEIVQEVINFGFRELRAIKVTACHALWNKPSERVLKKNGLSLIRHIPQGFKKNGAWVEENLLGITREEWQLNHPKTSSSAKQEVPKPSGDSQHPTARKLSDEL